MLKQLKWKLVKAWIDRGRKPPQQRRVYFTPLPDITTEELAWIYSRCVVRTAPRYGIMIQEETWITMPSSYKRHFSEVFMEKAPHK